MDTPHLTHVERLATSKWLVSCLCGWSDEAKTKTEAIKAGENHWARFPV